MKELDQKFMEAFDKESELLQKSFSLPFTKSSIVIFVLTIILFIAAVKV